jgi:hypothetical protein
VLISSGEAIKAWEEARSLLAVSLCANGFIGRLTGFRTAELHGPDGEGA